MSRKSQLVGQLFGRLTVVCEAEKHPCGHSQWKCRCQCGAIVVASNTDLKCGKRKSCGCFRREFVTASKTTHGCSATSEYKSWSCMKNRCLNSKYKEFNLYGGRGINICDRWTDFSAFLADMGPKSSPEFSIERNDVNGNYCPENCRWADDRDQSRNRRSNRKVVCNGYVMTATEAAKILNIKPKTLHARLRRKYGAVGAAPINLDAEDREARVRD